MRVTLLEILRCPFCGSRLRVVENEALCRTRDVIESGVLGCDCCAFPVVGGIPVVIADDTTRSAMHALEAGRLEQALFTLLGLDEPRGHAFGTLMGRGDHATYKEAIDILSPDAEGTYFVYRFSDPTFVMAQTVLEGIGQNRGAVAGRALDLCGGSGHLSRVITGLGPTGGSALADVYFWKLWLATRFVAPSCDAVCCDANNPLPFARDTFSMVVLSDAFPYTWHKQLLADEMTRPTARDGVIVMPHLDSALGENVSAGMTLTPAAYRDLFARAEPRLFGDRALLEQAIVRGAVDLSQDVTPESLTGEPSLTLVASARADLFRKYDPVPLPPVAGKLIVNPLYRPERRHGRVTLTLSFPTADYEEEFAECKRYLAETITMPEHLSAETLGGEYESLRRRRIVIDAPLRYC